MSACGSTGGWSSIWKSRFRRRSLSAKRRFRSLRTGFKSSYFRIYLIFGQFSHIFILSLPRYHKDKKINGTETEIIFLACRQHTYAGGLSFSAPSSRFILLCSPWSGDMSGFSGMSGSPASYGWWRQSCVYFFMRDSLCFFRSWQSRNGSFASLQLQSADLSFFAYPRTFVFVRKWFALSLFCLYRASARPAFRGVFGTACTSLFSVLTSITAKNVRELFATCLQGQSFIFAV